MPKGKDKGKKKSGSKSGSKYGGAHGMPPGGHQQQQMSSATSHGYPQGYGASHGSGHAGPSSKKSGSKSGSKSKSKSGSKYGGTHDMPPGAGPYQQQGATAGARPTLPGGYQQQQMSSATSHGYPQGYGAPHGSGHPGSSSYAGAGSYQSSGTAPMGHQPSAVDPLAYLQTSKKPTKSDKAVLKILEHTMAAQAADYPGQGQAMAPTMSMGHQPPASPSHHPHFTMNTQPAGYLGQGQGQAMAPHGGYPGIPQQAGMPSQPVAGVHAYPGQPMNVHVPPKNYVYHQMGQAPAGPAHGPSGAYPYGQQ